MKNLELWKKIAAFSLNEEDAAFAFSQKLAKEQKWSPNFTARVICEYKKFLYLCMVLPNGASPSKIVDEAWHLHLTYTDNYWNKLCTNVLNKQLHHHPSKGGNAEIAKHENWYLTTLQGYMKEFEQVPPADIWDIPKNFDVSDCLPALSPFRVPLPAHSEAEKIVKEQMSKKLHFFSFLGFGLAIFLTVAILMPPLLKGIYFLIIYAIFGLVVYFVRYINLKNAQVLAYEMLQSNISPYLLAWLRGGEKRLSLLALHDATETCNPNLTNKEIDFQLKTHYLNFANPIITNLQTLEKSSVSPQFIAEVMRPIGKYFDQQLSIIEHYFHQPNAHFSRILNNAFWLIGVIRFFEGLYFHKPIWGLVIEIIVLGIVNLSVSGTKFWEDLKFDNDTPPSVPSYSRGYESHNLAWNLAMTGAAIGAISNWESIEKTFDENKIRENNASWDSGSSGGGDSSGDSDGGGGDSGGSDGGGCSSCGGCGGCGGD